MIYSATAKGPYKVSGVMDADSKRIASIIYTPAVWHANTVYYLRSEDDYDIVIPTAFKGKYFRVIQPGMSGAADPFSGTYAPGDTVADGDVIWECVAYNLLPLTDGIATSAWSASNSVPLANQALTDGIAKVLVGPVPVGVTEFTLTNHTTRTSGEADDVTLLIKVAPR